MSRYLSLSGSFMCSIEQLNLIKDSIHMFVNKATEFGVSPEQALLYLNCWHFPKTHVNWLRYVFFGGDVQVYAEEYIVHQMLAVIKNLNVSSLEEKDIEGKFYYDEEEGDKGFWIVDNKGVRCYVIDDFNKEDDIRNDNIIIGHLKKEFKVSY